MKFIRFLSLKNLKRKPARTAALVLLSAFLSLSVFGGSLVILSLQSGIKSYESRLGADIVVVPYEAQTKGTLESILLQGIPGYFYMDSGYLEKIRGIEGVEEATPQFFLASASAGCCSVAVQIIGFNSDTDFVVQPWIRENYSGNIGYGDIIVGSGISVPQNRTLSFYNTDCRIVAQLDQTGTGLDNAVYANMDTIKQMMKNAESLGFQYFDGVNAEKTISSIMIKVRKGYSIDDVTNDINIHIRHIEATQAKRMVANVADGLSGVSRIIGLLTAMIWLLAVIILMIAFIMITHERVKEFAVLRVAGASQRMLLHIVRTETAVICGSGAAIGIAAACLIVFPFSSLIKNMLDLPYLLPGFTQIIMLAFATVAVSVISGLLTSFVSTHKIRKSDTAFILRESI